ncbi:MAG: PIG-L family deacetylase [Candidatus Omnitrophica bacterium]|nr:PIG-L family deacetylase [Candidatus Omnitrophota bacterium]
MRKMKAIILVLLLLSGGCVRAKQPGSQRQDSQMQLAMFEPGEKVLILAPHPDDEAIACAGIIQKALKAGAQVRIVYLTNGDHNELAFIVYEKRITMRQGEFIHLGKVRQQESTKAMKFLGLAEKDLVFLGYPDYGTFEIFCKYWQTGNPFRDRLTRISSVPYQDNPSYGSEYIGENILADITKQLLDYRPDKIFVSHAADVNVDHKALYLFLQVALSDLGSLIVKPQVYPYLVHCVGWPKPRHYHPELGLHPPDKFIDSQLSWQHLDLSLDELDKKYRSILFYKSQTESSAFYLFAFARKNELFSDYPELELKPQAASEDKDIVYSDVSEMFEETEHPADFKQPDETIENKGSVSYAAAGEYFIVRLDKPKKLSSRFGIMLYIFGYNRNTPFALMPKIRIVTMGRSCKVFSAKKRIVKPGVILDFKKNYLIIKIPLNLLGQPDYTLTALKAYHGNLPIDAVVFRKVKIK